MTTSWRTSGCVIAGVVLAAITGVAVGAAVVLVLFGVNTRRPPEEMVRVLVPKETVAGGSPISRPEEQFEFRSFPKDSVPVDAVTDFAGLKGKIPGHDLRPRLPVTFDDLVFRHYAFDDLPTGYRAVPVKCPTGVAGNILPGQRVDLICIARDPNDEKRKLAKIFLQDILVLAVVTTTRPKDDGTLVDPGALWVALKPEEAEREVWASQETIIPVVRKAGDLTQVKTSGASSPFKAFVDPPPEKEE